LAAIDKINISYGGIENYTKNILGVKEEQIQRIRECYLEKL